MHTIITYILSHKLDSKLRVQKENIVTVLSTRFTVSKRKRTSRLLEVM